MADGLRTTLGEHCWPVIRDRVSAILTVEDEAILEAMRLVREQLDVVVEPSGAAALAAALSDAFVAHEVRRVGIVLSGGNVDTGALPRAAS